MKFLTLVFFLLFFFFEIDEVDLFFPICFVCFFSWFVFFSESFVGEGFAAVSVELFDAFNSVWDGFPLLGDVEK